MQILKVIIFTGCSFILQFNHNIQQSLDLKFYCTLKCVVTELEIVATLSQPKKISPYEIKH